MELQNISKKCVPKAHAEMSSSNSFVTYCLFSKFIYSTLSCLYVRHSSTLLK